jgi:hypothetical protein
MHGSAMESTAASYKEDIHIVIHVSIDAGAMKRKPCSRGERSN